MALIFVGAPIAKAIGRRIEQRDVGNPQAERELRNALQATELRLSESESRLAAVEERLDFYEKLLANPESRTRKPE